MRMTMMMKTPIQVISFTTETFAHFRPVVNTLYTAYSYVTRSLDIHSMNETMGNALTDSAACILQSQTLTLTSPFIMSLT